MFELSMRDGVTPRSLQLQLASYTLPCQVQTVLHYAQYTDQSQIRANLDTPRL